jgi:hypothetical protein
LAVPRFWHPITPYVSNLITNMLQRPPIAIDALPAGVAGSP